MSVANANDDHVRIPGQLDGFVDRSLSFFVGFDVHDVRLRETLVEVVASFGMSHLGSVAQESLDPGQRRDHFGTSRSVAADHRQSVICQRASDQHAGDAFRIQRQSAIVLEQHHRFASCFQGDGFVFGVVHDLGDFFTIGKRIVKQPKLKLDSQNI